MDRLFDVEGLKPPKQPRPVRVQRGTTGRLFAITFGMQREYLYEHDEAGALRAWVYKHPALTPDVGVAREVPQSELDQLAKDDPKLFRKIRNL